MKQLLTILVIVFFSSLTSGLFAQIAQSKINIDLYRRWQAYLEQSDVQEESVELLIQGNIAEIKTLLSAHKGYLKYSAGNIASVRMPVSAIGSMLESPFVIRMEAYRVEAVDLFYEDTAMVNNNKLLPVHNGEGILPYGFKGAGSIVGIIDDGNEWRHPDFLHPSDSSTRFLYLWDQTQYNPNFYESFYAYGSSWTGADIDSGYITHTPGVHGSHVLGSAAGNALASGKYVGIAPEADLIGVSLRENSNFLPSFLDAAHFIFSKATELGQPCAINSSVGTYYGSHDGSDLYTQLLETLLDEAPGRAIIQAGGNARQSNMHWQADLQAGIADTARLWLRYVSSSGSVYASFFSDTADLNGLNFSFELIDGTSHQVKGQTLAYNILNNFQPVAAQPVQLLDTLFFVNNQPVVLRIFAERWAGYYEVFFQIYGGLFSLSDYWQLTVSGAGRMDLWSSVMEMGSSNLVMNGSAAHYRNPDNKQTIVSGWTCSDKIITVAAYHNRNWLENYNGDTISLAVAGYPKWGIASFSSLGPTRDGRQKPDLAAPGGRIMSCAPLSVLNSYRANNFVQLDNDGWHIQNSGTSMAAPMVTGAAALYFQCRPNATYADVKNALLQSARLDSFVFVESGTLPNIHWGYGKLDVFELMQGCMVYGCTDSTAPNYNPSAHLDDGSCILPVGVGEEPAIESTDALWSVMPNPATDKFRIKFHSDLLLADTEVYIYDVLGREILRKKISTDLETIDCREMATGFYTILLIKKGAKTAVKKLIIR